MNFVFCIYFLTYDIGSNVLIFSCAHLRIFSEVLLIIVIGANKSMNNKYSVKII